MPYADHLYASDWWQLFPTNDYRSTLTWRDRLADFHSTVVYNFYSSGEEVLRESTNYPPTGIVTSTVDTFYYFVKNQSPPGCFTWTWQEKSKGRASSDKVLGSTHGGWKFNKGYDTNGIHLAIGDASLLSNTQLSTNAFFDFTSTNFLADSALYATSASAYAQANRNRILSDAIPALTLPIGANHVSRLAPAGQPDRNTDMNSPGYRNGWPLKRTSPEDRQWHHSDFKQIAYPYTYPLFDDIANLGHLY